MWYFCSGGVPSGVPCSRVNPSATAPAVTATTTATIPIVRLILRLHPWNFECSPSSVIAREPVRNYTSPLNAPAYS